MFTGREARCWKYVGGKPPPRPLLAGRRLGDVFRRAFRGVAESGRDWCWELRTGDEECTSAWRAMMGRARGAVGAARARRASVSDMFTVCPI